MSTLVHALDIGYDMGNFQPDFTIEKMISLKFGRLEHFSQIEMTLRCYLV